MSEAVGAAEGVAARGQRLLVWGALALVTAALYAASLRGPFVYDDKVEVIGNPTIRLLDQWSAIATYNPSRLLVIASYAWNYHLWGLNPLGYHVVNLGVHLAAVGAALSLAEAVGRLAGHPRPLRAAALGVGLWAVHPMGAQAVAYVTGRSESLTALFSFAALSLHAQALATERRTGAADNGARALSLLAFLGAVFSKEVGAVVPVVALAMELIYPGRAAGPGRMGRLRAVRWAWLLPCFLALGAAAWLRFAHTGALLPVEVERPIGVQLVTQAEVWRRYLGLWLFPVAQTLFHVQPDLDPRSARGGLAVAGWLLGAGAAIGWGRRCPSAGLALLAAALFLLPSSSVAPLKEHMAEHRAYAPGLFLCLAVVWSLTAPRWTGGALRAPAPGAQRWVTIGGALAGIALAVATVGRARIWASEVALWEEAARRAPDSAQALYGLGDAARFAGDFGRAVEAYSRAVQIAPDQVDAWVNLGICQAERGDAEAAAAAWREALRHSPSSCKAHNNLGYLAMRRGKYQEALVELRTALSWCPEDPITRWHLGNLYYEGPLRDPQLAAVHYQALLDLNPNFERRAEVQKRLLELTW